MFVSVQSMFLRDYQSPEEEVIRGIQDLAQQISRSSPRLQTQGLVHFRSPMAYCWVTEINKTLVVVVLTG